MHYSLKVKVTLLNYINQIILLKSLWYIITDYCIEIRFIHLYQYFLSIR